MFICMYICVYVCMYVLGTLLFRTSVSFLADAVNMAKKSRQGNCTAGGSSNSLN